MAKKNPKVTIVILNWNRKEDTAQCLKSLRRISTRGFEISIIVVDNGSTDSSVEALGKITNIAFRLIENKTNLGFVEGNNVGINFALEDASDYVLILNDDTLADRDLIVQLIKSAEKDKRVGIVTPKIYFAPGFEFHKDRYPKQILGKVIWSAGGKLIGTISMPQMSALTMSIGDNTMRKKRPILPPGLACLLKQKLWKRLVLLTLSILPIWKIRIYPKEQKRPAGK